MNPLICICLCYCLHFALQVEPLAPVNGQKSSVISIPLYWPVSPFFSQYGFFFSFSFFALGLPTWLPLLPIEMKPCRVPFPLIGNKWKWKWNSLESQKGEIIAHDVAKIRGPARIPRMSITQKRRNKQVSVHNAKRFHSVPTQGSMQFAHQTFEILLRKYDSFHSFLEWCCMRMIILVLIHALLHWGYIYMHILYHCFYMAMNSSLLSFVSESGTLSSQLISSLKSL